MCQEKNIKAVTIARKIHCSDLPLRPFSSGTGAVKSRGQNYALDMCQIEMSGWQSFDYRDIHNLPPLKNEVFYV